LERSAAADERMPASSCAASGKGSLQRSLSVSAPGDSSGFAARLSASLGGLAAKLEALPQNLRIWARRRRLAKRYLRGSGLEIGALHTPLPLPDGATVRYVDRMDRAGLRAHYPELAEEALVEVDIVDDGETLGTQLDASADFIIANHFIEHAQDPLGTLANHLRVLRPGGILYLAVPDRRRTFDVDRSPTPLEHIVRDHREGPAWSRPMHQEEWARLVDKVPAAEVPARVRVLEQSDYSIHFHVWTPSEFNAMLEHAQREQRLPFAIEDLRGNGSEFIAILRRV
jgi:predicted SAM-dependent methyltransferase